VPTENRFAGDFRQREQCLDAVILVPVGETPGQTQKRHAGRESWGVNGERKRGGWIVQRGFLLSEENRLFPMVRLMALETRENQAENHRRCFEMESFWLKISTFKRAAI
jgi:hypothetical protein